MAGGLTGFGRSNYLDQSISGFDRAAQMERSRNQTEKQLEQAEQQQTMSMVGTGAGIGAMYGPVGMAVGAGAGYLASEVF